MEEAVRLTNSSTRFFTQRGIEPVLKIAQVLKQQLDEFKPKVPLLVALRRPGMVERHWQQISEKLGKPVAPSAGFSFTSALDLGLMEIVDDCVEIGEKA